MIGEPTKYEEAVKDVEWVRAMEEEHASLIQNGTWILTTLPSGKKVIDNKWVFKLKQGPDGKIERYKARLVVRGFSQEFGMNYFETYSPVVKFTTLRAILALTASENLEVIQFDVKTAFLYGELEEEIYMKQPIGYNDGTGRVCKLLKSLYGLKQASRCWNKRFSTFIQRFGFETSEADPCLFVNRRNEKKTFLTLYIDDGLLASNDPVFVRKIMDFLKMEFEMKFSNANVYLGLQIKRCKDGAVFLHQTGYAEKMLKKFNMEGCNGVAIPADPNSALHGIEELVDTVFPYREAVGSLMYLMVATRPDICYAVNVASRYIEKPDKTHVNAVKRIFKYLKATMDYGILYKAKPNSNLFVYSDADYAGDVDTRLSTGGYACLLGDGVISWASEKQKTVALSTTESEYIAACQAVKELIWLKGLLKNISNEFDKPYVYLDNQSALKLIKNPEFHKRTKHIDVRYHFIRSKYEGGEFHLKYVSTNDQIADVFTKALGKAKFIVFRRLLGITKNDF